MVAVEMKDGKIIGGFNDASTTSWQA